MGITYSYDNFGSLESEAFEGNAPSNHKNVIRRLDDSGNIFETSDTGSRKYGKGGQLLGMENRKYQYNDCGDMIEKSEVNGKTWQYFYHPGGLMEKVVRPDGKGVSFSYDPLGRRISKEFDGRITKYLWDGDLIIHEWIEEKPDNLTGQNKESDLFSWLYADRTFTPVSKLTREKAYSVISDHLGTPNTLLDQDGKAVWTANFDIYGKARTHVGGKTKEESCLFRFPGQYEDEETGLYYNRFRYYMLNEGIYTQRDPIGLEGSNPTIYGYVSNTNIYIDPFGLYSDLLSRGYGHHLVPRSVAKKLGLSNLKNLKSIAWYPNNSSGTAKLHEQLHRDLINQGVPYRGSKYTGTVDDFWKQAGKAYESIDTKGYLKIPKTNDVLYKNLTPAEALEKIKELEDNKGFSKKVSKKCGGAL